MNYTYLFLILFFSWSMIFLNAQNQPISKVIDVNGVKAVINSNGALFWDFDKGQFITPYEPGQPELSTIKASGLWIAGKIFNGDLKGAIQLYNDNGSKDFIPGLIDPDTGTPLPFNDIWRVSYADIKEHLDDFGDNGVIDQPNSKVFGWPARGNSFFSEYNNGLTIPDSRQGLAPYFDQDGNGMYDPDKGDYPRRQTNFCNTYLPEPQEFFWFAFHDETNHTQSGMDPLKMEVQCLLYAYDCQESDPLKNTIIAEFKFVNRNIFPLDSLYFGIFTDFDIGNPMDDFWGSWKERNTVFAYNGDPVDDGAYRSTPPVMAVTLLQGPLNQFGSELGMAYAQPVGSELKLLDPVPYYLLSGRTPNGEPDPNNGLYFPDNPNDPLGNSELTLGNEPGDRRVISSFGPSRLDPGAVNKLIVAYTFYQEPGNTSLQNVDLMYNKLDTLASYFNQLSCQVPVICRPTITSVQEEESDFDLKIFPNPASNTLRISTPEINWKAVSLTSINGVTVFYKNWEIPQMETSISVENYTNGCYFLQVVLENGLRYTEKIMILK